MKYLYARYRSGEVDRDTARKEKNEIRKAYEHDTILYKIFEAMSDRWEAIRPVLREIEQSDNELCRKVVRLMDGRERPSMK